MPIGKLTLLFLFAAVYAAAPVDAPTPPTPTPDVTAAEALNILKEGNRRFRDGTPIHNKDYVGKRGQLLSHQKPHTILLSCSDSRVPPEIVFDQTLGDLFVVREAGNIADSHGMASIEYALVNLKTQLLVVMGHESCGAVRAALALPSGECAGSEDLDNLIWSIQSSMEKGDRPPASGDELVHHQVVRNVNGSANNILATSEIVQDRVRAKQLKVVRGIYDLKSGEVEFWE